MKKFLIIIEKMEDKYSAYSPDLPGCVATGLTASEITKNMTVAIEMHIEGLLEDNLPIPEPQTIVDYVEVNYRSLEV